MKSLLSTLALALVIFFPLQSFAETNCDSFILAWQKTPNTTTQTTACQCVYVNSIDGCIAHGIPRATCSYEVYLHISKATDAVGPDNFKTLCANDSNVVGCIRSLNFYTSVPHASYTDSVVTNLMAASCPKGNPTK